MSKAFVIKLSRTSSVVDRNKQLHGWTVESDTISGYTDVCLTASDNDEDFKNFKKNEK